MEALHQGDILKIEKIHHPVLVVSRNSAPGPLHIWMATKENEGYIQCEKLALLDLSVRGYMKVDRLPITEMINVSDAIQGIFEYI